MSLELEASMKKIIRIAVACAAVTQCLLLLPGHALSQETIYTVQVMLCKERDNALEYLESLREKGIEASIAEGLDSQGQITYRVQAGSFPEKDAASQYANTLTAQGIDCWVRTEPRPAAQGTEALLKSAGSDNTTQPMPSTSSALPAAPDTEPLRQPAVSDTIPRHPAAAPQPLPANAGTVPPAPDNTTSAKTIWPSTTKRTYKYFDPEDGTLHVTNALNKIPVQFRARIREIAIYPVKYISLNSRDMVLLVSVDGEQKKVRLGEVIPSEQKIPASCLKNFEEFLRGEPLRIKYYPGRTGPDGTLQASLYLHTGISLGLEMVRQGIALHNPEGISALELREFTDMENRARQEKACIWSAP